MQRATVTELLVITPRPPSLPGVYMFLDSADRIMYVGMAHDLEKVLYRYQGLAGRQKMRDRAAEGLIDAIAWFTVPDRTIAPTYESVLISRYAPPWNRQHNSSPRSPAEAVPLTESEAKWVEAAGEAIAGVVETLGGANPHPRSDPPAKDTGGHQRSHRSTCRDLVLASMKDLERNTGRTQFKLDAIVKHALRMSDAYPETTIRTHIVSIMCADAPVHHMNHTNDLRRVSRGVYERVDRS